MSRPGQGQAQQPRLDNAKLKPYFDAINNADPQGAYQAIIPLEKLHPRNTLLNAYKVYSQILAHHPEAAILQTLDDIRLAQPTDDQELSIIRFVLKKSKYSYILTEIFEDAVKKDPKNLVMLKHLVHDLIRNHNWKRVQALSTQLYTLTKDGMYLIWGAAATTMYYAQIIKFLHFTTTPTTPIPVGSTMHSTNAENTTKTLADCLNTYKLLLAMIKREYTAPLTQQQVMMKQYQQKQARAQTGKSSSYPAFSVTELPSQFFLQYMNIYTTRAIIQQYIANSTTIRQSYSKFVEFNNEMIISSNLYATAAKDTPILCLDAEHVFNAIEILNDEKIVGEYRVKQHQQYYILRLQYYIHYIITLFNTPPPTDDSTGKAWKQNIINIIENDILTVAETILRNWPDQWNIISIFVYFKLLLQTQSFPLLATLKHSILTNNNYTTTNDDFVMGITVHPFSLDSLSKEYNFYDLFNAQLNQIKYNTSDSSQWDLIVKHFTPQSITITDITAIKINLIEKWIYANTPLPKGPTTTEPSSLSGKYPSRGLLLALLEVNRLSLLINHNIQSFSQPDSQHHTIQQNIHDTYVIDMMLYYTTYCEKPHIWEDMAYYMNTLLTISSFLTQHTSTTLPLVADLANDDTYPAYYKTVLSFTQKTMYGKNGVKKSIFNHRQALALIRGKLSLPHNNNTKNVARVDPIIWTEMFTLYVNSFMYCYNLNYIVKDEFHYIKRQYQLDILSTRPPPPKPTSTKKGGKQHQAPTAEPLTLDQMSLSEEDLQNIEDQQQERKKDIYSILLQSHLISTPCLVMPLQMNSDNDLPNNLGDNTIKSHLKMLQDPNMTAEEKNAEQNNNSTILHPKCLQAYINLLTMTFALNFEQNLAQPHALTQKQIEPSLYQPKNIFNLIQTYPVVLQLIHIMYEYSQPNYQRQMDYKLQLEMYNKTKNHLELNPPAEPVMDEVPALLGSLAIYMLVNIYNWLSLVFQQSDLNCPHSTVHFDEATNTFSYSKSQLKIISILKHSHTIPIEYIPAPDGSIGTNNNTVNIYNTKNNLVMIVLCILSFLNRTYPYDIQSQLLHLKLFSHPNFFNLLETYRVFLQMSIKSIQMDTLSYLSPVLTSIHTFDQKVSTIMSKKIVEFHMNFYSSDSDGFESAFKEGNTISTLSMLNLTNRVMFSSNYFNAYFTLMLNEACFVKPVKLNQNLLIVDSSIAEDFDFEENDKKSKKTAEKAPPTKKSTADPQQPDDSALKKADIPIHFKHLQLIHNKDNSSTANSSYNSSLCIHLQLSKFFSNLFSSFLQYKGKYLPTLCAIPNNNIDNIVINAPTNFEQLLFFVSNRQNNYDYTVLKPPTLYPLSNQYINPNKNNLIDPQSIPQHAKNQLNTHNSSSSALFMKNNVSLTEGNDGGVSPITLLNNHCNNNSYTSLHNLVYTPIQQYQSELIGGIAPSVLHVDKPTSNALYNDYYHTTDEQSYIIQFKCIYNILLYIVTTLNNFGPANAVDTVLYERLMHVDPALPTDDVMKPLDFVNEYNNIVNMYYSYIKTNLVKLYGNNTSSTGQEEEYDMLYNIELQEKTVAVELELFSIVGEIFAQLCGLVQQQQSNKSVHLFTQQYDAIIGYFQRINSLFINLQIDLSKVLKLYNNTIQSANNMFLLLSQHFNVFQRVVNVFVQYVSVPLMLLHQYYNPSELMTLTSYQAAGNTDPESSAAQDPEIKRKLDEMDRHGFSSIMSMIYTYQVWYQTQMDIVLNLLKRTNEEQQIANAQKNKGLNRYLDSMPLKSSPNIPNATVFNQLLLSYTQRDGSKSTVKNQPVILPKMIQEQQRYIMQHTLWNNYYVFENVIMTLKNIYVGMYIPFDFTPPQPPPVISKPVTASTTPAAKIKAPVKLPPHLAAKQQQMQQQKDKTKAPPAATKPTATSPPETVNKSEAQKPLYPFTLPENIPRELCTYGGSQNPQNLFASLLSDPSLASFEPTIEQLTQEESMNLIQQQIYRTMLTKHLQYRDTKHFLEEEKAGDDEYIIQPNDQAMIIAETSIPTNQQGDDFDSDFMSLFYQLETEEKDDITTLKRALSQ